MDSRRPARLRIGLFGGFSLTADPLIPASLSARQQGLVACLLLHRTAPLARHRLAGLLWPDSNDAQALTNLRRELHHIRRVIPNADRYLDAEGRTVGWRSNAAFESDLAEFESAVTDGLAGHRAALVDAVRLYTGDLLPACDDEWIRPERERLRRRAIEALARLVDVLEGERAFGDAIEHAERLLRMDPLYEAAWRALIRGHAARGQRASALHAYQTCVSVLQRDVGAQPSAATRLLYRELVEGDDELPPVALPVADAANVHPLVGRAVEWAALLGAWQMAAAGRSAFALVRGEAGIGKTRLVEELADWCGARGVRVAVTRSYAGEGRLAYAPLAAWLGGDALQPALAAIDSTWLVEAARLRPELLNERADPPRPEPSLESWQRRRFFEGLARVISAAGPILLVLDDIQWCDADTLDWLTFLFHFDPRAPLLVAATLRSEDESDNAAFAALLRELKRQDRVLVVDVGPLDAEASTRLAEVAGGRMLDAPARASVARSSHGHPLFIIEATRMGLSADGGPVPLPPRVQAVVAARLAELSPPALALAELAAAMGRDFTVDLVAAASDLDEDALVSSLDELWRRRVVRETDRDRWDFTHDRIREVTYSQIGPARRRLLHRRVAQALELVYASDLDEVSIAIASQLEQAQQPGRAVEFFERAAYVAMRVCASEEAIRCLSRALAVLSLAPPSRDRDHVELRLQRALCTPLTTARGYTAREVESVLERAIELATTLGDADAQVRTLWGLGTVRLVRGNITPAHAIAERAAALSAECPSPPCHAHHLLGGTLLNRGDLSASRREFESLIAAYDPDHPAISTFGSDFGVFGLAWVAHVLCLQGEAADALDRTEASLRLAERTQQPYNLALANAYAAITHQLLGNADAVRTSAEAAIALCERYGFAYYGEWALTLLGWVRLQEGRLPDSLHLLQSGINRLRVQGALIRQPYYLSLLAEGHMAAGAMDAAAAVLDAALATAEHNDDRWWLPELHRLRGLTTGGEVREQHFTTALAAARAQGSRLLERRATDSLAHLGTIDRTLSER